MPHHIEISVFSDVKASRTLGALIIHKHIDIVLITRVDRADTPVHMPRNEFHDINRVGYRVTNAAHMRYWFRPSDIN